MNPVLKAKEEFKQKILELFQTKDSFTNEEKETLDELIECGDIETKDIRVDFKEWVSKQNNPNISTITLLEYTPKYHQSLTHKENLKFLLDNLVN